MYDNIRDDVDGFFFGLHMQWVFSLASGVDVPFTWDDDESK